MIFNDNILDFIYENFYMLDEKGLKRLKDVINKELNLENRLNGIISVYKKNNSLGMYDFDSKTVIMNYAAIENELKYLNQEKYIDKITSNHFALSFYQTFLHEIVHIYQCILRENENDVSPLTRSLRDSFNFYDGDISLKGKYFIPYFIRTLIVDYFYRTSLYDYFPEERHAEGISYSTMNDFYSRMFPKDKDTLKLFRRMFLSGMGKGYEDLSKCKGSLEKFYTKIGRKDIFDTFDFGIYSEYERYLYGMPLTNEEYSNQVSKLLL